tara:strand:+ start:2302 stop:2487 length:186 start_codon:yes stop_codon:yes gene_type:complete
MNNKLRSPKDKKFNGMSDNKNNKTSELGMMSVNAGRDNKPGITKTDIILAGQQNAAKKGRA